MAKSASPPLDRMPTATEGLPEARRPETVELADGDSFELDIAPVQKRIGDATVPMLAYKGTTPRHHDPRPPRPHRALARAPAREPLRRHARHAGAHSRRRDVHLPGHRSRPRCVL